MPLAVDHSQIRGVPVLKPPRVSVRPGAGAERCSQRARDSRISKVVGIPKVVRISKVVGIFKVVGILLVKSGGLLAVDLVADPASDPPEPGRQRLLDQGYGLTRKHVDF